MNGAAKRPALRPAMRLYLLVLGGCFILFAVNAVLHGLVIASTAANHALARELATAEQAREEMEVEIAYLSSYPRIIRESEIRLAMRPPLPDEFRCTAPVYGEPAMMAPTPPHLQTQGLVATVGEWLKDFGRVAASSR